MTHVERAHPRSRKGLTERPSRALRRYASYLEAKFDRGDADVGDYATYVDVMNTLRHRDRRVAAGRVADGTDRRRSRLRPSR